MRIRISDDIDSLCSFHFWLSANPGTENLFHTWNSANVNAFDLKGNTPLHEVIQLHNEKKSKTLVSMAQFLVASGANLNATNTRQETPLDLCNDATFQVLKI